jgi:hypothetical protein
MNEKELGKALLQLEADKVAAEPNAAQLTQPILNRDKRRVRLLTGLTIATWVVAGLLILCVLLSFIFIIIPQIKTLTQNTEAGNLTSEQTLSILRMHTLMFLKSSILIALSVLIMSAAALFTVLLLFVSRQATLRQVTANLAEVSQELKNLRSSPSDIASDAPAKSPGPASTST